MRQVRIALRGLAIFLVPQLGAATFIVLLVTEGLCGPARRINAARFGAFFEDEDDDENESGLEETVRLVAEQRRRYVCLLDPFAEPCLLFLVAAVVARAPR